MNDILSEVIVKKPWGYEYLCYENEDVAVWFLHIDYNQKTSMHCHSEKTTGLLLLDGIAKLNFLADSKIVEGPYKHMIRRGLFHQTEALSFDGINLLEIETPVDKNDLVRLTDDYGRSDMGYEKESIPKNNDSLWFEEPLAGHKKLYKINNVELSIERPTSIDFIDEKNENDILMFVSGGLYKNVEDRKFNIVVPGDIGQKKIVTQVRDHVTGILDNTMVITVYG